MSCPDCFRGRVRTDKEPTGTIGKVYGRDTYTAEPPDGRKPKGIIVIVTDVFGWDFKNNRLLADAYASQGDFKVYLPDFMDGHSAPLYLLDTIEGIITSPTWTSYLWKPYHVFWALRGYLPWARKNNMSRTMPRVQSFMTALRASPSDSVLPVGAAGFCWGAQHIVRLGLASSVVPGPNGSSGPELPLADVLFTAHPSKLAIPKDIEGIVRPFSIAAAEKDIVTTVDKIREAKAVLKKNGVSHEVVVYEGAVHGWSVRCERGEGSNGKQQEQAEEAERQAVRWFGRHFAEVKR